MGSERVSLAGIFISLTHLLIQWLTVYPAVTAAAAGESNGKWSSSPFSCCLRATTHKILLLYLCNVPEERAKRENLLDVRFIRVETSVREGSDAMMRKNGGGEK